MIDRASIFADPEIVESVRSRFIPAAIDVVHHQHQKDSEGDFYRGFAAEGGQGFYVCAADGKRLGFSNHRGSDRMKDFLNRALEAFQPVDAPVRRNGDVDRWWVRQPPEGGLVVNVSCKVLDGYVRTDSPMERIHAASLGRDHLWVRKEERESLARGVFPESLGRRLARYHLIDSTRGSSPLWEKGELKKVELSLKGGTVTGSVHLETPSGDRGYRAEILGFVEAREGQVIRFDVVARGEFWGHGPHNPRAPVGRFPFAVAFTLASGKEEADRVPPEANRSDPDEYLR